MTALKHDYSLGAKKQPYNPIETVEDVLTAAMKIERILTLPVIYWG